MLGAATAYFLSGVDDLAEGLRHPAGQFGELVTFGFTRSGPAERLSASASPEVSTATRHAVAVPEFDEFAVPVVR